MAFNSSCIETTYVGVDEGRGGVVVVVVNPVQSIVATVKTEE